MPMQTYTSTTARAGSHVRANMGLWIGVLFALTIALGVMAAMQPKAGPWIHMVTLAGMLLGILVMVKSQEGYVAPVLPDADD